MKELSFCIREFDPFPVLLEVGLAKDSGKGGRQVGHCVLALHILQASWKLTTRTNNNWMVSKISSSEMIIVNELMMKKIELTPDGAPFFSFSPFFSTSTLLTVLLAVLTSESPLLASESEQLEVGRRNNGTKWRDKRMWNYSQLAIKRCRQQSPAVHISCPAQKSSQGGLGRFKCWASLPTLPEFLASLPS